MVRYQVILAYDGTQFEGFQRQGVFTRTVQSVVEQALREIGWQGRSILAAGRTDTGVHASGQVIAFDFEWRHSSETLLQALNAHLPADVAAQQVQPAPMEFHPRFDAVARRYCYTILFESVRQPLRERYAWRIWPPLDVDVLHQVAGFFMGRHDFAAFGTPPRAGGSTTRTVFQANWSQPDERLIFEVEADAFLYRMVRRLVYAQVAVAQGRIPLTGIAQSLAHPQAAETSQIPGLAPSNGLVLTEVRYLPGLRRPRRNLENEEIKQDLRPAGEDDSAEELLSQS